MVVVNNLHLSTCMWMGGGGGERGPGDVVWS